MPAADAPAGRKRRAPARRGDGAALRTEIVAAATQLIAASGDASTITLRAVAREVGVAATSIYLHFDSADDLVTEVKNRLFAEFATALQAAADAAGDDPLTRIKARGLAYLHYATAHPGEYLVMFTARLNALVPDSPDAIERMLSFTQLGEDVQRCRPGGHELSPDDAGMISFHLWSILHGSLNLRLNRPEHPWPSAADQLNDLVGRLLG